MEISEINSLEWASRHRVVGQTTINHLMRIFLKLSAEEYIILDFIHTWNSTKQTAITLGDYYRETGYLPHDMQKALKHFKDRGLLVWDSDKKRIDVYTEWKIYNSANSRFEELWKIHPQGNKNVPKGYLPKVLKKISFDDLKEKLINYKSQCEKLNRYTMDLQGWLNPTKEHWNDILPAVPVKKNGNKPDQPKIGIRFKQ